MSAPKVIWVFLDGVGLGEDDPAVNPLAANPLPSFRRLAGSQPWTAAAEPVRGPGHVFVPLDAVLGMPGLPQSGTGQASLFTGVDCIARAGRHWGPFPHSSSKPIIAAQNVFVQARQARRTAQFLNAYPDRFFRSIAPRDRWTVTTRCCVEAGVAIRTETDLRAGRAIAADLTGRAWHERLELDVPIISPAQAGGRLVELADAADLTLFEYYLTDKAGHSRDHDRARHVLSDLDTFLGAVLDELDPERHLLIIASDHGNLEDLSRGVHTVNPVPLAALGLGAGRFHAARAIIDVVPALLESLSPNT